MIVASEPRMLTEWAVGFLTMFDERPRPRVAIHYGAAVYRDGDYFGSDVNLTHRIVTRALAGEVLVTRPVVDGIGETDYLSLEPIGELALKGLPEPTELFVATAANVRMR
jgi:adenylate cyclase